MKNKLILLITILFMSSFFSIAQKSITVSNVKELLKAIGSDTYIKLKKGDYNISDAEQTQNSHITWEDFEVFDTVVKGFEPIIKNVKNLILDGEDGARILISRRLARVLAFNNCSNVILKNIVVGHTDGEVCQGSVIDFLNCENIEINGSVLFGSGSGGIVMKDTKNFRLLNSTIRDCSYDLLSIHDCSNVLFENDSLINSGGISYPIGIYNSHKIKFSKCIIKGNKEGTITTFLVYIIISTQVVLENSIIENNQTDFFTNCHELDSSTDKFSGNKFGDAH